MQFVLVLIVILTNWLFIPKFEITGAAIATCISVFTYNIIRYIYLWTKFGIQPFSKSTLIVFIILIIAFFIGVNIKFEFHPILNIIFRSAIVVLPLGFIFYILKISQDINGLVNKLLKQIFVK